jgi:hypothetical protein
MGAGVESFVIPRSAVCRRKNFRFSQRALRPFFATSAFRSFLPISEKKLVTAENVEKSRKGRREKTEPLKERFD